MDVKLRKVIKNTRIAGVILVVVLKAFAGAAIGMMMRSLWDVLLYYVPELDGVNSSFNSLEGSNDLFTLIDNIKATLEIVLNVYTIVMLIAVIIMVYIITHLTKQFKELYVVHETGNRVKKAAYVWLGFLLGTFGAHLFLMQKKTKAGIFLVLGVVGFAVKLLSVYTMGVSFADALLATQIPKDELGYIYLDDDAHVF